MEDRLKFRGWSKSLKKMIKIIEMSYPPEEGLIKGELLPSNGFPPLYFPKKDVILMQCTGLEDKNGKLIYEGDVIFFENSIITFVIFEYGCFNTDDTLVIGQYLGLNNNYCEIIGNIYENPELIEKK